MRGSFLWLCATLVAESQPINWHKSSIRFSPPKRMEPDWAYRSATALSKGTAVRSRSKASRVNIACSRFVYRFPRGPVPDRRGVVRTAKVRVALLDPLLFDPGGVESPCVFPATIDISNNGINWRNGAVQPRSGVVATHELHADALNPVSDARCKGCH